MFARNFTTNHNGKLLNTFFSTLRPHKADINVAMSTHLITIGGEKRTEIGKAIIRSVRTIEWKHISETIAWIDYGNTLEKLHAFLIAIYKEKAVTQKYDLIVYQWTEINPQVYQNLMQKHYNKHIEPNVILPDLSLPKTKVA